MKTAVKAASAAVLALVSTLENLEWMTGND